MVNGEWGIVNRELSIVKSPHITVACMQADRPAKVARVNEEWSMVNKTISMCKPDVIDVPYVIK